MSKIRNCDRCGAIVRKRKATRFKMGDTPVFEIPWTFDLCKTCANELAKWLNFEGWYTEKQKREAAKKEQA